jgi:Dyp-type peroxidase family
MALFEDLQCNIISHHKRNYAKLVFICFGVPTNHDSHEVAVSEARSWLTWIAQKATSEATRRAGSDLGEPVLVLHLTAGAYEFIGKKRPKDGAFRDGMAARRGKLKDPPRSAWERSYRESRGHIHACVLVAGDNSAKVSELVKDTEAKLGGSGRVLFIEEGRALKDVSGRDIEHFGFVDGTSQPRMVSSSGLPATDEAAPTLVLEKDRHGGALGYGSFFVFRKLSQDVQGFNSAVAKVASTVGQSPELVGAMAVGRFKDGTPVVAASAPGGAPPSNNFDYSGDPSGSKCPIHAHIRKTNPRGEIPFFANILAREKKRRIARRGIPYGSPGDPNVGLLFMCYQSDIADQFEFIQRRWSNSPNFSKSGAGLDPVIGQSGGGNTEDPSWPTGWGSIERKRVEFGEYVKLIGGEYFFAPSLSGIRALVST